MRYTFPYEGKTKTVDVSDEWLQRTKKNLNLTTSEAINLWLCDNGYETNPIAEALTEKAKGVRAAGAVSDKPRKKPERKPDMVKRELVSALEDFLKEYAGVENVEVANVERLLTFTIGDDNFDLTLAKKRKPKN